MNLKQCPTSSSFGNFLAELVLKVIMLHALRVGGAGAEVLGRAGALAWAEARIRAPTVVSNTSALCQTYISFYKLFLTDLSKLNMIDQD